MDRLVGTLSAADQLIGDLSIPVYAGGGGRLQDKTVNVTPSESSQTQSVTADTGYDGLDEVTVNVSAIDSDYVGSGVSRRSTEDLRVNNALVIVPAGFYEQAASASVEIGSAGTPDAEKGSVSNHSVDITPTVTNTTGYISGGRKIGTPVSVSASELVSGTKNITENGTGIDVTNYESVNVNVPSGEINLQAKTGITPTTSSQIITPDAGYDGLSSVQIDAMPTGSYGTPTWSRSVASGQLVLSASYPDFDDGYFAAAPTPSTGFTVESKTVTPSDSAQTVTPTSTSHYLNQVTVNPITYSASDEGKVVSNGALTAQTSRSIDTNGTYDTTLNDEVVVNVSGSGGGNIDALIDGSITSVESDATVVEEYKFYNCTHLTSVKLNGVAWIKGNAFRGCTALQTFDAKNVYKIFGNAFMNVPVDALVFPNINNGEIGASAWASWKGTKVDLDGSSLEIKLSAFSNASHFNFLVLRRNTRVILGNTNAFNGTPFASGGTGGTLYVPQAILNDYTSATNWSTILGYTNNQIKSIESTHTDPTAPIDLTLYYADGTPIAA